MRFGGGLAAMAVLAMGVAAAGSAAAAPCATEGSASAATMPAHDPAQGMKLLVPLSVGLVGAKDFAQSLEGQRQACERMKFSVVGYGYALRGDGNGGMLPRVAMPTKKKGIVAYLTPVAAPGQAGPLGYALMTYEGDTHTAYAVYDAIPTDKVLAAHVKTVLTGQVRALMQVKGDKVTMYVDGGAKG